MSLPHIAGGTVKLYIVRHHSIKQKLDDKELELAYVQTKDQVLMSCKQGLVRESTVLRRRWGYAKWTEAFWKGMLEAQSQATRAKGGQVGPARLILRRIQPPESNKGGYWVVGHDNQGFGANSGGPS